VYKRAVPKPAAPITKGLGWVALFGLCLSCLVTWPLIAGYPRTMVHDAPFYQKMMEVIRVTITRYHELPLWNPFECGGVPLWDNPQGLSAAPLAYLMFLVGSTATMGIWYVAHATAGVLCMWALARLELRLSVGASIIAAASWAFAGVHTVHFTGGHPIFACFLYFPLAILLWRRAEHDLRAAVGLGLIAALIMLEGGTYPLPYLAVLLAVETLFRLWPLRRLLPIGKAAVVVFIVAFWVGAMRFLPVLDQLLNHHRDIDVDTDAMKWATLKDVFLAREHGRPADGQQYVWPEFGDYVGPMLLILAFAGMFALVPGEMWIFGLFVFTFALMCGHFADWAPWSVLNKYVFPFKQMRVPSRFVFLVTLFISIFAGIAVDRWPKRLRFSRVQKQRAFAAFLIGFGLVGVGDEISVGTYWATQVYLGYIDGNGNRIQLIADKSAAMSAVPQNLTTTPAERFHYGGGTAAFLDTPHSNIADLGCWEEWAFERGAPLWVGDVPQARGGSPVVHVLFAERTPNTFTVDVDASTAGRLLLNSTYDRGWRTDVGTVVEAGKMLAVDLPPGTFTVHVRYWPHGLTLGFAMSGFSALVGILFGARALRRWRVERREKLR